MSTCNALLADDRRGCERWRYTLCLTVSWGTQSISAYTSDISMSGMFVETNRCLPVGTAVRLDFRLVSGDATLPVSVDGVVARRVFAQRKDVSAPLLGIGVKFKEFHVGQGLLRKVLAGLRLSAPRGAERRGSARIPASIPVSWGRREACDQGGRLADLSVDGAFIIHTPTSHRPGTRLYLRFEVPHQGRLREVKAVATVVRSMAADGADGGMAVIFELSTIDVDYLHAFIARRLPADQSPGKPMTAAARRGLLGRLTAGLPSRGGSGGGKEDASGLAPIRLGWNFKALCYTVPAVLVVLLLFVIS